MTQECSTNDAPNSPPRVIASALCSECKSTKTARIGVSKERPESIWKCVECGHVFRIKRVKSFK